MLFGDLADDLRHAHARIRAAMAAGLAEALAALLLEHANLGAARLAVDDTDHLRVGNKWRPGEHLAAVLFEKEHLLEGDFLADLSLEAVDRDHRAGIHLDLTPTGLNDCEHDLPPSGQSTDRSLCFCAKELG